MDIPFVSPRINELINRARRLSQRDILPNQVVNRLLDEDTIDATSTDTLQNKTLDNTTTFTAKDANFTLQDNSDTTKQLQFQLSSLTTATTRTLTVPDTSDILVTESHAQGMRNKTIYSPIILPIIHYPVALTDAANITTDASAGNFFYVTLTDNRTLDLPSGGTAGQVAIWSFTQDATGNRTITLGAGWSDGSLTVTLSTTAEATDYMTAICANSSEWHVIQFTTGY